MNAHVLTLKRQPAVVDGINIAVRKLHIYKSVASFANVSDAPTVTSEGEEYLQDVTWSELTSANSQDANIRQLQLIRLMNGIQDEDAFVAHLQSPPRLYPVF